VTSLCGVVTFTDDRAYPADKVSRLFRKYCTQISRRHIPKDSNLRSPQISQNIFQTQIYYNQCYRLSYLSRQVKKLIFFRQSTLNNQYYRLSSWSLQVTRIKIIPSQNPQEENTMIYHTAMSYVT
jgi:hypothetical protein